MKSLEMVVKLFETGVKRFVPTDTRGFPICFVYNVWYEVYGNTGTFIPSKDSICWAVNGL